MVKIRYLLAGLGAIAAIGLLLPAFSAAGGERSQDHKRAHEHHRAHKRAAASTVLVTPESPWIAVPQEIAHQLASTGSATLQVFVGAPGTITLEGEIPVGDETVTAYGTGPEGTTTPMQVPAHSVAAIEPVRVDAAAAGEVDVEVHLTAAARSELAADGKVELALALGIPDKTPFTLVTLVPLRAG
jgi:hypothetical protein